MMKKIKKVLFENGILTTVLDDDFVLKDLPEGVTLEEREMQYTEDDGWREVGWKKSPSDYEKLKSDLKYIAIMAGVDL